MALEMTRLEPWSTLLKSSNGRDKLLRLVQYTLRMLRGVSPWEPNSEAARRAFALETSVTQARQVARLFRWVHIIEAQWKASPDKGVAVDVFQAVMDAGLFGFFVLDNINWVARTTKIANQDWIQRTAYRGFSSWWVSNVSGLLMTALQLKKLVEKSRRRSSEQENRRVRREVQLVLIRGLRYLMDIVVSAHLARNNSGRKGLIPWRISIVGTCGMISSAIAIWDMWPSPRRASSPASS